jgi:uncharacterized protein involved in response to NO
MTNPGIVLFGRGFRPFFFLAGVQALFGIGLWVMVLRGVVQPPGWSTPFQWHAHEMLFGFACAAVAGFLLTSVPAWTGRPALKGTGLAALATLWLAGRVALFLASSFPSPWIAAVIDVSFLVALGALIGVSIIASRSRRNYAFPVMLETLAVANGLTHLDAMGIWPGAGQIGLRLGVGLVVLLVAILGGRLVPLFTRAALRRVGSDVEISQRLWADRLSGPLLACFIVLDVFWPGSAATGVWALATASVFALRMKGWAPREAFRDPLLWSMHVAYLWIPIGLGILGLGALTGLVTRNIADHVLTVGVIGGMVLAIMTRVALGHTGRPFVAPRGIGVAYAMLTGALLARTLMTVIVPAWAGEWILISGGLWIGAFTIFLTIYTPFLISARVDGKPG